MHYSNNWYVKLPERALFPGGGVNALPGLQILRRYFAGCRDAYPGYRFCTGILPGGTTLTRPAVWHLSRRPAQAQRRRATCQLRAFVVSKERMKEAFALLKQLVR